MREKQHRRMLTVGGYYPAAGTNTIREASAKYDSLKPGDLVTMVFCDSVDDDGAPVGIIAKEELVISSVTIGTFQLICDEHLDDNHAVVASKASFHLNNRDEVQAHLRNVYAVTDDQTRFLAIYFA